MATKEEIQKSYQQLFESELKAVDWLNSPHSNSSWEYTQFREYLLESMEGKLLPTSAYPKKISLGADWAKTIQSIGNETIKSKLEIFSIVPGDIGKRRVSLHQPQVGLEDLVLGLFIDEARVSALHEGYTHILGFMHSHPESFIQRRSIIQLLRGDEGSYDKTWLSPLDYLSIGAPNDPFLFVGAIGFKDYLFAFRTLETNTYTIPVDKITPDNWSTMWFRQRGIRHSPELKAHIEKLSSEGEKINYGIAAKHRLVIFRGNIGTDELIREFPN